MRTENKGREETARARKILEKHATEVEQLAKRLITHKRVTFG